MLLKMPPCLCPGRARWVFTFPPSPVPPHKLTHATHVPFSTPTPAALARTQAGHTGQSVAPVPPLTPAAAAAAAGGEPSPEEYGSAAGNLRLALVILGDERVLLASDQRKSFPTVSLGWAGTVESEKEFASPSVFSVHCLIGCCVIPGIVPDTRIACRGLRV